MIFLQFANTSPDIDPDLFSIKQVNNSIPIKKSTAVVDFNYCRLITPFTFDVFATKVGNDNYKNDKNQFLVAKLGGSDVVRFELWNDKVKLSELNSNTYGNYYAGFDAQPLYVGMDLHWKKVQALHGNGLYKIKIYKKILGDITEEFTDLFRVLEYNDSRANGTVKIETWQTGNILSSEFDYTDLLTGGWYESHRISGFFGERKPSLETDKYLDSTYRINQVIDKVKFGYVLESELIPSELANHFYKDLILANKIRISDYNLFNAEKYTNFEVAVTQIDESKYFQKNRNTVFKMTFGDRTENNIKRNY